MQNYLNATKRSLRILLAHMLYGTGCLDLIAEVKLRQKAVILMYHRILDKHDIPQNFSQEGIIVSKETFESQMRYLKEKFNVISLNVLIEKIKSKSPFKKRSCLITFDDGWKDNFENAYPVLKNLGLPAVVFLPTDFIGSKKRFWQERLTEVFFLIHSRCQKDQQFRKNVLNEFRGRGIESIISSDKHDLKERISAFVSSQKNLKEELVEELIRQLGAHLSLSACNLNKREEFLNWSDIKIMRSGGIDFGSHSMSHRILTNNSNLVPQEISESKAMIEREIGIQIDSFSYPNGNYSEGVVKLVKENGYEIAFGTERGFTTHTDNPYTLKRINIHEDMTSNIPMFLTRVLGLW